MYTQKTPLSLEDFIHDIKSLQRTEYICLEQLLSWFGTNANAIHRTTVGSASRDIGKLVDYSFNLTLQNARPFAKVSSAWGYGSSGSIIPQLSEVADKFPGIAVDSEGRGWFDIYLLIDLDIWKNLVPNLVSRNMEVYAHPERYKLGEEQAALAEVTVLLERYHQHLKIDVLKTAVDLGLYSEGLPGYENWMRQYLTLPTALPAEFAVPINLL